VLLVDDDQPEAAHRREDRRPRADHHASLAACDPLALVAPLRIAQGRMEDRDPLAEPSAKAPDRLRRERDLRHEHDRPQPSLERSRTRLQVDLGLPATGGAVEQEMAAAGVERRDDALDGGRLRLRQRGRRRLARQRLASLGRRRLLLSPLARLRSDERERPRRRRAVVVGEPQREVDERRRNLVNDRLDRHRRHTCRSGTVDVDDDAALAAATEPHRDDGALPHPCRHLVRERLRQRSCRDERNDLGVPRHVRAFASASADRASPRQSSVLAITKIAASPIATLNATCAMFIPTLKLSSAVVETLPRKT
jgi:hypothetical protein